MNSTIQLHPLSLLVGVGFALLGVVAMGQMPAAKRPAAAHDSGLLQVAHPRDWVVVEEGAPYTVPVGKLLVITGLGASSFTSATTQLKFNGQLVLEAMHMLGSTNGLTEFSAPTVKPVPVGLRAGPGTTVEVDAGGSQGMHARAWGYLVDA